MCGIAGIVQGQGDLQAAMARMLAALRHRGPEFDGVGNRFARAADATRAKTLNTPYQVVSAIERQPLLFGGLALAFGALLGAVIPATQYEDRIVGELRDRAVERAKKLGERQYQNLRSRLETHHDIEVSGRAH